MEFLINGYWKDDKSNFSDYLVTEYHSDAENLSIDLNNKFDDDDYFYYGLSEDDIINAINDVENTSLEFVITSYTKC